MAQAFEGSFDQREQIRDAIDIVDLVERYVPLRRQGANFVGRCPWHDDSRPSLQVNAQRQTFKCWVCNIGGDVFSFVMKTENVDFKESMQILADMAGIELIARKKQARPYVSGSPAPRIESNELVDAPIVDVPYESSEGEPNGGVFQPQRDYAPVEIEKPQLYRAMEWLAKKYREAFLNFPEAEEARVYVRERGISDASSEKFQIGYSSLEFDATLRLVGFDRNRVRVLEAAGVLAYRDEYDDRGRVKPRPRFAPTPKLCDEERRRYYDRFRGRLIFPIRDVQDRVVAFGGRLLPNTTLKSPAKYVNSPETPIFVKSKMVYGLDCARNAIRKTHKVLITEGYTDCIVTSQFGFENVVAVLGTALGAEHVRILKRFADKMILLLDGDDAGQKRAKEVLRFFVEQGVDMSVLTLPDDDDPCEFLLEKGADAFAKALESGTVDAMEHAFRTTTAGVDLDDDIVGSAKALDSLLDVAALFPEETRAANDPARLRMIKTIQRLASRFRVDESEIRARLAEKRARGRAYAERAEGREERYERRRSEYEFPEPNVDASITNAEEARIAEYRARWVYPVASEEGESDETLRFAFPPFESSVWNNPRLMPNALEREYLETWLTAPQYYPLLVAKAPIEALRSPVARQLDLVARDYLERDVEPTFERMMLRYEDASMKSFLIELDDAAREKQTPELLANASTRETIFRDLFAGFERARVAREEPKKMSLLRESELSSEDKMKALLEFQRLLQERVQNRVGGTVYRDGAD